VADDARRRDLRPLDRLNPWDDFDDDKFPLAARDRVGGLADDAQGDVRREDEPGELPSARLDEHALGSGRDVDLELDRFAGQRIGWCVQSTVPLGCLRFTAGGERGEEAGVGQVVAAAEHPIVDGAPQIRIGCDSDDGGHLHVGWGAVASSDDVEQVVRGASHRRLAVHVGQRLPVKEPLDVVVQGWFHLERPTGVPPAGRDFAG
jgi:hypothetical protein